MIDLVRQAFSDYYNGHMDEIVGPSGIERREFGFLVMNQGGMIRHKSFRNVEELRQFIGSIVPSGAYYSAAYYERPEAKMDLKGWMGADLIFDIDADHIRSDCKREHDYWICLSCNHIDRFPKPERCPNCGSDRVDEKAWVCDRCLEEAKTEVIKLMDVLMVEFGFSADDLRVYFSGHRGYHLHIHSNTVVAMDQNARKEVVDYLLGIGISPRYVLRESGMGWVGWRGRILEGTKKILSDEVKLKELGLKRSAIYGLKRKISSKNVSSNLDALETERRLFDAIVESEAVHVDPVVTTDVHRLIRLPNTLHGKTGFLVQEVLLSDIDDYDPLAMPVVLGDRGSEVYVEKAPQFRLKDRIFGPYEKERVDLPLYAAVYLLLKGHAKLIS